jgi:tRNA (adenine58-N1)-methyltransferase non-catalytic subunit
MNKCQIDLNQIIG